MKNIKKIIASAILISLVTATTVNATTVDELKQRKSAAQATVNALENQLFTMLEEIELLKQTIEENAEKLQITTDEFVEAEEVAQKQDESMRVRIKYMYESGDASFLEKLLSSESISDLINQAEYVSKVHGYDRDMLKEYIATREKIEELKVSLEVERKELEENDKKLETKKAELSSMIQAKKSEVSSLDQELQAAIEEANRAAIEEQQRVEEQQRQELESESNKEEAVGGETEESKIQKPEADSSVTVVGPSAVGGAAAAYGLQFVGNPYVYGGSSLTNGADCSGFVKSVYAKFGYSLPHSSSAMRGVGKAISSLSQAQPGDIICYSGHVAIYIGGNAIVHASNSAPYPQGGIKTGSATYKEIITIRRIGA